jgi:hypothetical protein
MTQLAKSLSNSGSLARGLVVKIKSATVALLLVGAVALPADCLFNAAAASPRAVNTIQALENARAQALAKMAASGTPGIPLPHLPPGYSRNRAIPPMVIKPRHINTHFHLH